VIASGLVGTPDALSPGMQIIRRALILSSLALVLSGGAAFADRYRGGSSHGGGYSRPAVSHSYNRSFNHSYSAPREYNRGYRGSYAYGRRPIYMRSPVIREHYYNYYRRPGLVVENYAAMDGYVWVRGQWTWDGAEWIWQPGHYQPIY
jgi:hypothetical protein